MAVSATDSAGESAEASERAGKPAVPANRYVVFWANTDPATMRTETRAMLFDCPG